MGSISVRNRVLSELGVKRENLVKRDGKTPLMLLVEERFGKPVEELIAGPTPIKEVAARLGIDLTTVCKWRQKLHLNTGRE